MSTSSMTNPVRTVQPAQPRNLASVSSVQSANIADQVLNGFLVVDKKGEFLSWAEHVEVALVRFRELEGAHEVHRVSDGAVIAFRPRAFKATRT